MTKKKNPEGTLINCFFCEHFYITYEVKFPYGCKAMGFKSMRMPSVDLPEKTANSTFAKSAAIPITNKNPRPGDPERGFFSLPGLFHFPLKSAGRFSKNAIIASFKSSDISSVAFF